MAGGTDEPTDDRIGDTDILDEEGMQGGDCTNQSGDSLKDDILCKIKLNDLAEVGGYDSFYEKFDRRHDSLISKIFHNREREDLFKSLLVQIDNYNKQLAEDVQLIWEQENGEQTLAELEQPILNAHLQLRSAGKRIAQDDIVSALGLFYSARERRIKILEAIDTGDDDRRRVNSCVHRLIQSGEKYCGEEWVEQSKADLFEEDDGEYEIREDLSSHEITPWLRDVHLGIYRDLTSSLTVRKILEYFVSISIVVVPLIFATVLFTDMLDGFSATQDGSPIIYRDHFLFLIFLLGILGSAVNTVRAWPSQFMILRPEQPRLAITQGLVSARLLFGGIAAVFTYLLLVSGVLVLQPTPGLLIVVAFAVGFADKLFIGGIERSLIPESENDGLSPIIFDSRDS